MRGMKYDKLLKITEFGKMGSISRKMLIHYDKIGILKPLYVNPETNYRYYSIEQIENLAMIKSLQAIGVSLGEIKGKYMNSNIEGYIGNLAREKEKIEAKFMELEKSKKIIEDKLACLEEISDLDKRRELNIEKFPDRNVILTPLKDKTLEEISRIIYNQKKEVLGRDFLIEGEISVVKEFQNEKFGKNKTFLGLFNDRKIKMDSVLDFNFKAGEYLCFYKEGFAPKENNFEIIDTWCQENGYRAENRVLLIPVLLPFLEFKNRLYKVQVRITKVE